MTMQWGGMVWDMNVQVNLFALHSSNHIGLIAPFVTAFDSVAESPHTGPDKTTVYYGNMPGPGWSLICAETAFFGSSPCLCKHDHFFCQDRLGTNIGKAERKNHFLQGRSRATGASPPMTRAAPASSSLSSSSDSAGSSLAQTRTTATSPTWRESGRPSTRGRWGPSIQTSGWPSRAGAAVRASGVTGVTHPCTTGPLTPAPSPSSPLHQ
eukprot:COSAG06_NODE_2276_length_7193_cov_7.259374_12_plen_209_part_01